MMWPFTSHSPTGRSGKEQLGSVVVSDVLAIVEPFGNEAKVELGCIPISKPEDELLEVPSQTGQY
jgi:hypothetical protein